MKTAILLALITLGSAAIPLRGAALSKAPRLGGAEEPYDGEIPFVVSLQILIGGQPWHACAGTIYDETRIITAGHCLYGSGAVFDVVAGALDLTNLRGDEQSIRSASVKYHESYNNPKYDFNIGILTLSKPLVFNSRVQPMRLAVPENRPTGEVKVAGWGILEGQDELKQQKVYLNVVDQEVCRRDFAPIGYNVTENMICASAPGKFTWIGDEGGPLIAKDEMNRPYLAGLVSWILSPELNPDDYHSLFTDVVALKSWLDENLN